MASGGNVKRPVTVEHNFNYANTKIAFSQEIGYVILEKRLQTKVLLQKKDVEKIILDIKLNKTRYKKYYTEECQIVNENGKDILCQVTMKVPETKPLFVVKIKQILCLDDLFDIMFELHMVKPHLDEIGILDHFTNCLLFNAFINLFWKSCETCNSIIKNLDMYFRVIGEMTVFTINTPDGKFTDIFMYIERNTNFVLLRPLKSLSSKELAYELLTIFADFGTPTYLDSNISRYSFKNNSVLNIIKSLNPPFRIPTMYASSRNHKINVTTNKAIEMLEEWMENTGSTNWAIGTHIVQWLMNTDRVVDTYIRSRVVNGPIQCPYHALFGLLPNTEIFKIKDKQKLSTNSTKSKEKVLVDCSQCSLPIYKVFKCHFCHRPCHFFCCVRYIVPSVVRPVLINKCISCENLDMCVDEEMILGT